MITYYKRTLNDRKLKIIDKFSKGCWINVVNPTNEELDFLTNEFKLDKENLLSGLDKNEVPRVEFDDNEIYIIVKILSGKEEFLDTCLILITDKFILTLSSSEPLFVRSVFENKIKITTTQKLKTLIKFLSMINDRFERETIRIVKIVNAKKSSTKEIREKDLRILLQQEEKLNNLISSYYHTSLIYERLLKKVKFFEEDKGIMEDLIIDSNQGLNLCKSSLKTISNLRNYQTILLSNKMNRTITILTIFTIFLGISTAVSGFYGMNVLLPFQDNPHIALYLVSVMFLAGISLLVYFFRIGL